MTTENKHDAPAMGEELPPSERSAFEAAEIAYHQAQHPQEPLTAAEKAYVLRPSTQYKGYEACEDRWQGWQWRACMALRQPGAAAQMVPLSTDGKSVWIDGEGDVALCRCFTPAPPLASGK